MQVLCDTLLVHLYFAYVFCMHVFCHKLLLHYFLCMYFAIHQQCIFFLHICILPNKKTKNICILHIYILHICILRYTNSASEPRCTFPGRPFVPPACSVLNPLSQNTSFKPSSSLLGPGLSVLRAVSECFLGVLWVFCECTLSVLWVFSECSECFLMFPECALSVVRLFSECAQIVL